MDVNVQKQCVKVFTAEGVINMQPLLVLTQDLSGVAQQDTLVQGIGDIRDDISTLAKQGTNPDANLSSTQTAAQGAALNSQIARGYIGTPQSGQADTLFGAIANINIDTSTIAQRTDVKDGNDTAISVAKEIRSEVGTGSDTAAESGTLFAVVKWVKDKVKSIFNLIGSPASGQPSTLFAAIAAGGGGGDEQGKQDVVDAMVACGVDATMTDTLTTLANKILANFHIAMYGTTLYNEPQGGQLANVGFTSWFNVRNLVANGVPYLGDTQYNTVDYFSIKGYGNMRSVTSDTTTLRGFFGGSGCNNLQAVILPRVSTLLPSTGGSIMNLFRQSTPPIRHLHSGSISLLTSVSIGSESRVYDWMSATNKLLYDVRIVMGVSSSISFNLWDPTDAVNSSLTTIIDVDDWDNENQPTFNNNLEKFLWYFKNHFMTCFNDMSGQTSPILSLKSTVYNVISADAEITSYFSSRNWTLASV